MRSFGVFGLLSEYDYTTPTQLKKHNTQPTDQNMENSLLRKKIQDQQTELKRMSNLVCGLQVQFHSVLSSQINAVMQATIEFNLECSSYSFQRNISTLSFSSRGDKKQIARLEENLQLLNQLAQARCSVDAVSPTPESDGKLIVLQMQEGEQKLTQQKQEIDTLSKVLIVSCYTIS